MHSQGGWNTKNINPGMLLAPIDFIMSVTEQPSIEDLAKGACAAKDTSRKNFYNNARFMYHLSND